jgi:hypothetical protein
VHGKGAGGGEGRRSGGESDGDDAEWEEEAEDEDRKGGGGGMKDGGIGKKVRVYTQYRSKMHDRRPLEKGKSASGGGGAKGELRGDASTERVREGKAKRPEGGGGGGQGVRPARMSALEETLAALESAVSAKDMASTLHEASELAKMKVSGVILNLTRAHVRLKEIVAMEKEKIKFAGECQERMLELLLTWKSTVERFTDTFDHIKGSYEGKEELMRTASSAGVRALGLKLVSKFVTVEVLPLLNDHFWMQLGVCAADKFKILSALPPHLQVTLFFEERFLKSLFLP